VSTPKRARAAKVREDSPFDPRLVLRPLRFHDLRHTFGSVAIRMRTGVQ